MNSDVESSRKKRKRSASSSSSERSRSRSKSRSRDRKKSKREKKRRRSRSKEKSKRKRSKSNKKSSKRKEKRERSKSRSSSTSEEKFSKYPPHTIPAMDPQMMGQYMYYPTMINPRDARMVRPPMYYPPFPSDPYRGPVRHPVPQIIQPPKITETVPVLEAPTDKIVKDQNFLNSDEKLFESIVNNEMNIRSIYEDTQISESYAGSTLFKTVKKILHDPTTTIFESDKSTTKSAEYTCSSIKPSEIVELAIDDFLNKNSYNKLGISMGDMTSIKGELSSYRNRVQALQLNNI